MRLLGTSSGYFLPVCVYLCVYVMALCVMSVCVCVVSVCVCDISVCVCYICVYVYIHICVVSVYTCVCVRTYVVCVSRICVYVCVSISGTGRQAVVTTSPMDGFSSWKGSFIVSETTSQRSAAASGTVQAPGSAGREGRRRLQPQKSPWLTQHHANTELETS